jgi:plasmid stabilization system protein ParE
MTKSKNNFSVIYSERSFSDVQLIERYLLERFSTRQVSRFHKLLLGFENVVQNYPSLFTQTSQSEVRRAVLSKELSVFYQLKGKQVYVLTITDNRCDLSEWL